MEKSNRRKIRVRSKLKRNSSRNRMSIFKSNSHVYVQVINDIEGLTLTSASSLEKDFRNMTNVSKKEMAEQIGKEIAKRSIDKGIKKVAFDKGKYKFHGIVKILADSARKAGLDF